VSQQQQDQVTEAVQSLHYGAEYAVVDAGTRAAIDEMHGLAEQLGFSIQVAPNGDGGMTIWKR
jgi:hypothetical protein